MLSTTAYRRGRRLSPGGRPTPEQSHAVPVGGAILHFFASARNLPDFRRL